MFKIKFHFNNEWLQMHVSNSSSLCKDMDGQAMIYFHLKTDYLTISGGTMVFSADQENCSH